MSGILVKKKKKEVIELERKITNTLHRETAESEYHWGNWTIYPRKSFRKVNSPFFQDV